MSTLNWSRHELIERIEFLEAELAELPPSKSGLWEKALKLAHDENERLEAENAELRSVFGALVNKLDAVHNDQHYRAVWECAQVHRGPYSGSNYIDELAAARTALAHEERK